MLQWRFKRLAAGTALASYLLASVVVGSVHHHAPHSPQAGCCHGEHDAGHAHACCHHHGHAHQHGATHRAAEQPHHRTDSEDASLPLAPAHEECAVCRFLAQAVEFIAIPVDEQRAPLRQCVPPTMTPAFVAGLPTTHFSRGPPVFSVA